MNYKNLNWKKTNTSSCSHIYIDKKENLIYKKFYKQKDLYNLYETYEKIKKFDFIPKMSFDFNNNIIIETYYDKPLNFYTKPDDYEEQLKRIDSELLQNNYYHNDYKNGLFLYPFYINYNSHFFVDKHNNIKLIDWNNFSIGNPKPVKTKNNIDKFLENFSIKHNPYNGNINVIISYCKYNIILYTIIFQIIVLIIIIYILYIIIKKLTKKRYNFIII